jgi:hypothetical protein
MRAIVVLLFFLTLGLNASSTASAADRCFRVGSRPGPPQALVVARPKVDPVRAVERAAQDGKGAVVVRRAASSCATTFWVGRDGRFARLWVDGWHGTVSSGATRVPGLVAATDISDAVRGGDHLHDGGRVDLAALERRLDDTADARMAIRIALAVIMIALVLVAPRRALLVGPAAITTALLLSAFGWSSVALFALLTILGSFAPVRSLWLFFAAYLVVLAVSPETQSLALLGPHPESGGRFYGLTNEVETLLLAPALLLGLAAAPLVIVVVAWSKTGADGGGALVFLASYAVLAIGLSPRRLAVAAVAAGALALAFVGVDAATGGSSHVTETVGDGPGAVWDALVHRWSFAWHEATATGWRTFLAVLCAVGLVVVATRRPRYRLLDAFLVGIAVSLAVNDTPQDVLLWGSLQALALRRARID